MAQLTTEQYYDEANQRLAKLIDGESSSMALMLMITKTFALLLEIQDTLKEKGGP